MGFRKLRIVEFMQLYSENYRGYVTFFYDSFSKESWIRSIIQDLVELGKRLSKVDPKKCGRKKSRRCIHACYSIMFGILSNYASISKESMIRFDQFMQKLYGFSKKMALLLCNIAFDIVQDQRFKHLLEVASKRGLDRDLLSIFSIFFGKVKLSAFAFPKNLSFYITLFSAQCICARSNPRKRLLTTSGFVNILIRKFDIQQIFPKRNPNDNRKRLFKRI